MIDVAVIGGGFSGLWTGLAAARCGLRSVVFEQDSICNGVSTNSLGVLHGGLRYLASGNLAMFRQSILSRDAWFEELPEAVRQMKFSMPLAGSGLQTPSVTRIGLSLNNLLTRAIIGKDRPGSDWRPSRLMRPQESPNDSEHAVWWDGYIDAPTAAARRLVRAIEAEGGAVREGVQVVDVGVGHGVVNELRVRSEDGSIDCHAVRYVVDASGPAVGKVFTAGGLVDPVADLNWVSGANIDVDRAVSAWAVGIQGNDYDDDGSKQGTRQYFAMPIQGGTRLGTCYSAAGSDPDNVLGIRQLLDEFNTAWPGFQMKASNVLNVSSGQLPARRMPGVSACRRLLAKTEIRPVPGVRNANCIVATKLTTAPLVAQIAVKSIYAAEVRP